MSEAFDQIQEKRTVPEWPVRLLLDQSLARWRDTLRTDLAKAMADQARTRAAEEHDNQPPGESLELAQESERLGDELRAVKEKIDDAYQVFIMTALERKDLEALRMQHKPSPVDEAEGFAWNRETFPPALLAASCREPKFDAEEWVKTWDTWAEGDVGALFDAAWKVNTEARVRPFLSPGSDPTPASVQNLITAPIGESLTPDS